MPALAMDNNNNKQVPTSNPIYASLGTADEVDITESEMVTIDFSKSTVDASETSHEELEVLQATTTYLRIKLMLSRGLPIVGSFFISYLSTMILMLFASHYGFKEGNSEVLAGVTLANLFGNVSFFSILVGLSSAVETLAAQNFGAKNYEEVGIVLQRSVCILTVVSVPLLLLWVFAGEFFGYCGVEANVVDVISKLLAIRILSFPGDILNISYEKYLCAIGVTTPTLLYAITQNIVLLVLLPIMVLHFKLSFQCIAVAQVISIYTGFAVHVWSSMSYDSVRKTLQPLDRRALEEWKGFISLGVPGAAMICSEWWAYEILAFMASKLGTASVAAQSLMLQIICLAYMIPLGLSIATASLVGNALGAKQIELAKQIARLSYFIIFSVDFIIAICLYCGGVPFIHFLSNDQQVINIFVSMLGFLSLVPFIDGNQSMSSGIMRGTGKQAIGAMINFAAFYFIGLPCAWYFCFKLNFGVSGLLKGLYVGAITQTIILSVMVLKFDDYIFAPLKEGSVELVSLPRSTESIAPEIINLKDVDSEIDVESGVEYVTNERV